MGINISPILIGLTILLAVMMTLVVLIVWNRVKTKSINRRLQLSFILLTILPAIGISFGIVIVSHIVNQKRAIDQLESVVEIRNLELTSWSRSVQDMIGSALDEESSIEQIRNVLSSSIGQDIIESEKQVIRESFITILSQSSLPQGEEMFLIDRSGTILISTIAFHEGQDISERQFFTEGLQTQVLQISPQSSFQPWSDGIWVFGAQPVYDQNGTSLGVIAIRFGPRTLLVILAERTGLGRTGRFYLARSSGILSLSNDLTLGQISDASLLQNLQVFSPVVGLDTRVDHPGNYQGVNGQQVVGYYRRVNELDLLLIAEQDQIEVFGPTLTILLISMGISLLSILLATLASIRITRGITNPLNELAGAAAQISQGNLNQRIRIIHNDEIGVVALAFNSMASQLQELITTLEQRVGKRTEELHQTNMALRSHSLKLETSAKVSLEISSILSLDELLKRVVDLITDAFGYYHINILLLEGDELVLKARSGQTGSVLTHFPLGLTSLNTVAFHNKQAILVNDVKQNPYYFPDPALPDVASEVVVPLRVGDNVIGTMDVNSKAINGFSEQDFLILQGLGSQVAIAIENAHLYERSRDLAIVEERNRLARNLHDSVSQSLASLNIMIEGWRRLHQAGGSFAVEDFLDQTAQITNQSLKELRLMVHELRSSSLGEAGLVDALQHRLDYVENRGGIKAQLIADDLPDLPLRVEEELYWIAREALNNTLRHSAASQLTVYLQIEEDHLVLKITDNGQGFDYEEGSFRVGVGLSSMKERAQQLNAAISIMSASGSGTTIQVRVPIESINSRSPAVEK